MLGFRAGAEDAALARGDPAVVDGGLAAAHQAAGRELPQLVAVAAPPLARGVPGLVLEADGDAVAAEAPQVLAQRVVELALPLLGEELDDFAASGEVGAAVAPDESGV